MLKTVELLNYFIFFKDSLKSSKEPHSFEIFCNIINGFTVTFDQFNHCWI